MATHKRKDASGGVNRKPAKGTRTRKRELKKRTYEFKLTRVREAGPSRRIDSPEVAYDYWNSTIAVSDWFHERKEHLVVLLLNIRNNIEGHNLVSIGSLNETLAHPREILSPVLCGAAYGFILMHNHPSGDPEPSAFDRTLTRRISDASSLLQLSFIDHVIAESEGVGIGDPYFSFKEMGLL